MDDYAIEKLVRKGLKSPKYLNALLEALDEHYQEAVKEGNGVAVEMYMASIVFVSDALDKLGYPGWRSRRA